MKKLILMAYWAILVGAMASTCSAATCAAGYIKSIDYDARAYDWIPHYSVTVDQTGMSSPATATFVVGMDGGSQTAPVERWNIIKAALQEAMRSRFPIRVTSAGSCTNGANAFVVKVCSNEADCRP